MLPRATKLSRPADDVGRFGNSHLRWSILYAILIVAIAALPLVLSGVVPHASGAICAWIMLGICACWLSIALFASLNFCRIGRIPSPSIANLATTRARRFRHIVIM
jgi:hypothetical protein